jgi:hypothetical protein
LVTAEMWGRMECEMWGRMESCAAVGYRRHVGQDGILRGGWLPPGCGAGWNPARRLVTAAAPAVGRLTINQAASPSARDGRHVPFCPLNFSRKCTNRHSHL